MPGPAKQRRNFVDDMLLQFFFLVYIAALQCDYVCVRGTSLCLFTTLDL